MPFPKSKPGFYIQRFFANAFAAFLLFQVTSCETVNELFSDQSDGKVVQTDEQKCIFVTPENSFQGVTACQTKTDLTFEITGKSYLFSKATFRREIRAKLSQLVQTTSYSKQGLETSQIQMWLVAPAFRPEAAYLVAVVLSAAGNFLAKVPLASDQWIISKNDVQLLGNETFPSLKTKKAGLLVLQARERVTSARLKAYLASCQIYLSGDELKTTPIVQVNTPLFAEAAVARRLLLPGEAKQVIEGITFLPAGGEEGSHALIDAFSFSD